MSSKRLLCLFLFVSIAGLSLPSAQEDGKEHQRQAAGMELGFLSVPILTPDPYSFAASASLWYEYWEPWELPMVLGAWAGAAGFRPLDDEFGLSLMYYGGVEAGYPFYLYSGRTSILSLRPLIRFGWYYRSVEIQGSTAWGSRPFLSTGCLLDFKTNTLDLGLAVLASVPLDNDPVLLFGFVQRLGTWF